MPRHNLNMDLIPGKIRKRGCSSSASSSSSIIQNYRFKRAILVGKRGGSSTPVPTWKLLSSRSRSPASAFRTMDSPKYAPSQSGGGKSKQAPVSARKLAATLWEINELPSPKVKERLVLDERRLKKDVRARERVAPRSVHSSSFPPHLSDPSHSPVSERMDRSGTGSRCRRTPSVSQTQRLKLIEHNGGIHDSISNASLMEIETRSRAQTPASTVGVKSHLKAVSNALTTSKELLKIINRMWGHEDRPSSSMSVISALHAELERARLQTNELIQEQRSTDVNYLMKCFAEEKAAWKSKEQEVVEAAIESVAGELEVERKLRRRSESLNKKLGRELAETKASLLKVVKELESEKRAREIIEQVCDELARDIEYDKVKVEEQQRESAEVSEEVKKDRLMRHLANGLLEERAQMDISEAKYEIEEKSAAVDKLRHQLEAFLGNKKTREKDHSSNHQNDVDLVAYLSRNHIGSHWNDKKDAGEGENGMEYGEDSAESDLCSIELNMDNSNKSYSWLRTSGASRDSRMPSINEERKERKSLSGKVPCKSTSLQRSISDGVDWRVQDERLPISADVLDGETISSAMEKQAPRKFYGDDIQGHKSAKSLRDQILSSAKLGSSRVCASPKRQWGAWPSRDPTNTVHERSASAQGNGLKSRLMDVRGEGSNTRKPKR